MALPLRRRTLLLALVTVVALGVLLFFLLRPNTLLDTGPLDLPGVPDPPGEGEEVLLAVGDIGFCGHEADDKVAELAAQLPGTIAMLGDSVYPDATAGALRECLEPAWGPMLDRIRPILGNHDYVGARADAYFDFFGSAAGERGEGWYSYQLGEWHVVALNSNLCLTDAGCGPGTPQHDWLLADLSDADADCLLAYWHHPLLSSGRHGRVEAVRPLWDAVVEAGVDVTLHGHDHTYERLTVDGVESSVESFVVGTGGRSLYQFERDPLPQTSARHDRNYGLLYLVLGEGEFTWDFLTLGASTFTDAGSGDC
ncbi:MAG TPA: metallophosphoesterase [Candidatus Limnocylindria bacterium]